MSGVIYGEYFKLRGVNKFTLDNFMNDLSTNNLSVENYKINENFVRDYIGATIMLGEKLDIYFIQKDPFSINMKPFKNHHERHHPH